MCSESVYHYPTNGGVGQGEDSTAIKKKTILEKGSVSYYEIYPDQVWFILPALELLPLNRSLRRSVTSIGAATSIQVK